MRVLSLAVLTGLTSAVWATSAASVVSDLTLAERGCSASDARLLNQRKVLCHSLTQGPTPWCGDDWRNVSASEDWPNQAIYMLTLLRSLATPTTCLNTSYSRSTVAWLDTEMASTAISGNFMNTWLVFQLQYYDMPRLPGTRIESPDTLGRKCWAMAYLTQQWADIASPLERRLATAGLSAANFTAAYERAMPLTMGICQKVICNWYARVALPCYGRSSLRRSDSTNPSRQLRCRRCNRCASSDHNPLLLRAAAVSKTQATTRRALEGALSPCASSTISASIVRASNQGGRR